MDVKPWWRRKTQSHDVSFDQLSNTGLICATKSSWSTGTNFTSYAQLVTNTIWFLWIQLLQSLGSAVVIGESKIMTANECQKTTYTWLLWCTSIAISLKKFFFFFYERAFSYEHQNIGLKHLIQCVCFAWWDGTQSSVFKTPGRPAPHTDWCCKDLRDLSWSWVCLSVTFLKYDWLESYKQWRPRDWWSHLLKSCLVGGGGPQP